MFIFKIILTISIIIPDTATVIVIIVNVNKQYTARVVICGKIFRTFQIFFSCFRNGINTIKTFVIVLGSSKQLQKNELC